MTKLFWFSRIHLKRDNILNFGDELSKDLVEKITGDKVKWINPLKQNIYQRNFTNHVLGIGSILHFSAKNSQIWGSGLIEKKSIAANCEYYAVRGKYTRNELLARGCHVPEIYGDPGLLTPKYFPNTKLSPSKKIGIIPHYVEYDMINEIFEKNENSDEIELIDLRNSTQQVLSKILNCENILSSSLHGIIVPQAYGIKTLRISLSDKIYGDGIKYMDYFDSVGIQEYKPMCFNESNLNGKNLQEYFNQNKEFSLPQKDIISIQDKLLRNTPF